MWKANNDVLDGIRFTGALIQSGRLRFNSSCVHTFEEFGLYRWDEDAAEDKVVKENDHAMDSMRYLAMTVLRREMR